MRAKTGTNANKRATRSHGSSRARACCLTNEKDRHHAGRAAGRRGQGDRLSRRERGDRLSRNARMSRQGRGGRAWRECRSPRTQGVPKPCPLPPAPCRPACLPLLASLPNTTPGRGCSHGCPIRRATKRPENFTIPRRHRVNLKYKILLIKKSFASKIIKKGGGEPPLTEKTP